MTALTKSLAAALTALALLGAALPANAAEPDFSKPATVSCDTSAVRLDANPFEATKGAISLELVDRQGPEDEKPRTAGRWKVVAVDEKHTASFAVDTLTLCAPDCPFTRGEDGAIQLWSPKPLGLTQLEPNTALVLVSLDPKTLEMKASSFRNKELAGLERGECRLANAEATETPSEKPATPEIPAEPTETPPPSQSQDGATPTPTEPSK